MGYFNIIDSLSDKRVDEGMLQSMGGGTHRMGESDVNSIMYSLINGDFNSLSSYVDFNSVVGIFNNSPFDSKISPYNMGSLSISNGKGIFGVRALLRSQDFYMMVTFNKKGNSTPIVRCGIYACLDDNLLQEIFNKRVNLKLNSATDKIDGFKLVANTYYNVSKEFVYTRSLPLFELFSRKSFESVAKSYKGDFDKDFRLVLGSSSGLHLSLDPDKYTFTVSVEIEDKKSLDDAFKLLSKNDSIGKYSVKGSALNISFNIGF